MPENTSFLELAVWPDTLGKSKPPGARVLACEKSSAYGAAREGDSQRAADPLLTALPLDLEVDAPGIYVPIDARDGERK